MFPKGSSKNLAFDDPAFRAYRQAGGRQAASFYQ